MSKRNLFQNTDITIETFLQEYWHKKPLLLKSAIHSEDLRCLPAKQELMQLAMDEDIPSRVVCKNSSTSYSLSDGPFFPEDFETEFQDQTWNLLVSDIDKWHPQSHKLLQNFNFIRSWLFDDLMLSCGAPGGTVGPHLDNYDVFLVQSQGQRRWQFSVNKTLKEQWLDGNDIKVLKEFDCDQDILLSPGDVLYLPPRFAHYGTVESGDCVTCSVGLRSPSVSELMTSYVDHLAQDMDDSLRFVEPEQSEKPEKGQITTADLNCVEQILQKHLTVNKEHFGHWFGKYISEYRSLFYEFNEPCEHSLNPNLDLHLNSFARVCYKKNSQCADFYANGIHLQCSTKLAKSITEKALITSAEYLQLDDSDKLFLQNLFENGTLLQES